MVNVAAGTQTMEELSAKRMREAPKSMVDDALRVSRPIVSSATVADEAPRKVPPAKTKDVASPIWCALASTAAAPASSRRLDTEPRDDPLVEARSSVPAATTTPPPRELECDNRSTPAPVLTNPWAPATSLSSDMPAGADPTRISPPEESTTFIALAVPLEKFSQDDAVLFARRTPLPPSTRNVPDEFGALL